MSRVGRLRELALDDLLERAAERGDHVAEGRVVVGVRDGAQGGEADVVALGGQAQRGVHGRERGRRVEQPAVGRRRAHGLARQRALPGAGDVAAPQQRAAVDQRARAGHERRCQLTLVAPTHGVDVALHELVQGGVPGEVRAVVGLRPATADPAVEPGEPVGVLARLVVDVGASVHRVPGRRLDREGVRRQLLGLAPALLVLAHERELAGVPPVVAVGAPQPLHELRGLAAGGEAAERDGRYGDAHRERVAREQPDVAQQRGGPGLLVAAEPRGHGVEEADLAVVEVAVGGRGVRGLEGLPPGADGTPLVAEQRKRGVGLGEARVGGDRGLETGLDAVLEAEQPAQCPVVGGGGLPAGRQGEAVRVHGPAAGLAVQRAGHRAGHVVGLLADLRHRRGLPQVAAAQRADRVERDGRRQHAEHAAVVGGVDAEPGGAGPDQPGPGERREERVVGRSAGRTRAVDDAGDGQLGAVAEGDVDTVEPVAVRGRRDDGAGVAHPATRVVDVRQAFGRDGRHPVAVGVPGAGVVGEEGTAVVVGEPAPELGGDRTQPVDGGPPVTGLGDGPLDVRAHCGPQLVERVQPADAGRRRHGRGGRQHVVGGDDVVARHRVQRAVLTVGRDRDVDHRQAGADEQQVAVGELVAPGVEQPTGRGQLVGCPVGAGLRAGREHHGAGDDRAALVEADDQAVTAPVDPDHAGLAAYEAGVGGVLGGRAQQALDVVAVDPAGHEVLRLGLRVVVLADPAVEVLGVARERAHAAGRDVEEVPVVGGRVRRAASGARGGVDELDAEAGGEPGDQVRSGQRTAGARSHHHHAAVAFTTVHRLHPLSPLNQET